MHDSSLMGKRSNFVFRNCTHAAGWVQIDTNQDASYYCIWCHPDKRQIVSYRGGHITIIRCADDETFAAEMRRTAQSNQEWGYWIGIDAGEDQRHRFIHLGLADLLQPHLSVKTDRGNAIGGEAGAFLGPVPSI